MALTLYTNPGNFRAFKILIAAEYNNVQINVPDFEVTKDNVTEEFLKKSPLGKVPVLETPQGSLFESNAIARYIARMRRDTELTGASYFESGQVDSWIDFCAHDVELPVCMWIYPILGYVPANECATNQAKSDLARALGVLEQHLLFRTYLVGHKVTLADIVVASALVYPFKLVCTAEYLAPFPCVVRWFTTLVNQQNFKSVIGSVKLASEELTSPSSSSAPAPCNQEVKCEESKKETETVEKHAGKSEKASKKPKKETDQKEEEKPKKETKKEQKPKDDDEEEPEESYEDKKKDDHPLKILDRDQPSPFSMDTWKKTYSNSRNFTAAMEKFWEMYDASGYSLWRCDYKYNEECTKLFMTCNLVGGFLQRSNDVRKWAFGCMWILGEEGKKIEITGLWLIRGDSIQPLLTANDDAEHYNWQRIANPVTDADKEKVKELWCSETVIENRTVLDYKCFK